VTARNALTNYAHLRYTVEYIIAKNGIYLQEETGTISCTFILLPYVSSIIAITLFSEMVPVEAYPRIVIDQAEIG